MAQCLGYCGFGDNLSRWAFPLRAIVYDWQTTAIKSEAIKALISLMCVRSSQCTATQSFCLIKLMRTRSRFNVPDDELFMIRNLSERHFVSHMIILSELFIKNFFNWETLLLSLVVVVVDVPVTHLIVIINNEHRWLVTLNYSYIRTRMIKSSLKWLYTGRGWLLVKAVATLRFPHFYCWYGCQKA